ncbi:hypothetical protein N1851_006100 [Merluccius polli]|uniref:Reverse transcriptase domain-containing protein n=1 Tax=Merluccius polli TaxID=89951 RepID=A0AA47P6A8_MERPO|nr:hypothetical protein N1851_006100 [Merluccius polli]
MDRDGREPVATRSTTHPDRLGEVPPTAPWSFDKMLERLRRMVYGDAEHASLGPESLRRPVPEIQPCVGSQLIREAKESKGDLTVVWLDLANAYGSIPHDLINTAMEHYHIPQHIRGMITTYFSGFKLRFRTTQFTTQWQDLEKGIVTGCTISPIFLWELTYLSQPQ